ncbi:hypothetical protein [Bacillus rubiinfantis]|uniref:hypothetical protein n=1 Tax=Bacillus rubiinfantis TaxID=1499680 RepID=UPI0005A90292|nr:hypothetical protein [Bacillus rubiinfantis]
MESYYYRLIHSKKAVFMTILLFLIPAVDLLLVSRDYDSLVPFLSTFLSSSSLGHIPQILLKWFLPVYLLILCADNYIEDYHTGFRYIIGSKQGRFRYYRNTILGNMSFSFIVIVTSLFLNMLLAYILFRNGQNDMGHSLEIAAGNHLEVITLTYPVLTNIIYILIFGFLTSLAAGFSTVICWCFPSRKYAYPLSFIIWYSQILGGMSSLAMATQSFNELDFTGISMILTRASLLFILIIVIGFVYKVKMDEV